MTDAELERRVLEFVYTTEAVLTVPALAYFAPCSLGEAEAILDQLASKGTIRAESDDDGNMYFVFPNRHLMPAPARPVPASRALVAGDALAERPALPPPATSAGPAAMMIVSPPAVAPVPVPPPIDAGAIDAQGTKPCPFCGETILAVAKKCKHCGEMLDPTLRAAQASPPVQVNLQQVTPPSSIVRVVAPSKEVSPGVAAVLSFLWPGAGQMYAGSVGGGIGWMFATFVGYIALVIPGLILHVLCIASAASTANATNARNARLLSSG